MNNIERIEMLMRVNPLKGAEWRLEIRDRDPTYLFAFADWWVGYEKFSEWFVLPPDTHPDDFSAVTVVMQGLVDKHKEAA